MENERNRTPVYNGIGILFVVLSVLMILFVGIKLAGPEKQVPVGLLPTPFVPPTATHTLTPTVTLTPSITPIPTWTPLPTETPSPTITIMPSATITPSPTITDTPEDTLTPSNTPTASISPTLTPTETPTGPTPTHTSTDSPYFFALREEIRFGPNTMNTAGCAWQGVGGVVLGIDGQPTAEIYQIRLWGEGFDNVALSGSNSLYGPQSGWEIPVGPQVAPKSYFVRIESRYGTPLSQDYAFTFPGTCEGNLALVRFIQTAGIGPSS